MMTRDGYERWLKRVIEVKRVSDSVWYVSYLGWSIGGSGWSYKAARIVRRQIIDEHMLALWGER